MKHRVAKCPHGVPLDTGCDDCGPPPVIAKPAPSSHTNTQLEPCPKCRDTAALCLQSEQVFCGRCAFEAPLEAWNSRASVAAPQPQRCQWCEKGDLPLFLDNDGTRCDITRQPGILSHAHEEYWWPCLRFGFELHWPAASSPVAPSLKVEEISDPEQKARYESAHPARYLLTHPVHPDILVLWFLALKSHWFDDPNNMFYGMREQAKIYLYKWVETGKLADDNTTLEITTAMKFREWLDSLWAATTPVSPSDVARKAAEEISSTFGLRFQEDSLHRVAWIISRHFTPTVVVHEGDEQRLPIEDLERDHFRDHPPEDD